MSHHLFSASLLQLSWVWCAKVYVTLALKRRGGGRIDGGRRGDVRIIGNVRTIRLPAIRTSLSLSLFHSSLAGSQATTAGELSSSEKTGNGERGR